ncbi:MAG: hypothetical protein ACQEVT_03490 [Pseudomonadota bacterium]|uniref:hypothetical protein n=1 Tax=Roseovarius TaxID=74030 RepID=UPI0022A6C5DC|nr:hypothetical protein [Roseovarius sp. EGI FJ00037]MCZ0811516.1 hypothetical protein [Roseovarius sp. EGI FJ00037]
MFVFLLILLVGVVIYFLWRHQTTTLTRNCRWRQDRSRGVWRCAYCGAETGGDTAPRDCLRFK